MRPTAAIFIFSTALLFSCSEANQKANADQTRVASIQATEKKEWIPVDQAMAEQKMWEVGTPGEHHAMLARASGTWEAEMTMWMSDGAPPQVSKSSVTNKMLFDNRYQQSTFKGSFGDMPFEGVSITGYDNAEKKFFSTWMDNMSTGIMNMKGDWDETKKSMTLTGTMLCPANGIQCEMKEVYTIVDDNNHLMEMYGPDMQTGKAYKNMEIRFTRKK